MNSQNLAPVDCILIDSAKNNEDTMLNVITVVSIYYGLFGGWSKDIF
jgi:hypothetical protein